MCLLFSWNPTNNFVTWWNKDESKLCLFLLRTHSFWTAILELDWKLGHRFRADSSSVQVPSPPDFSESSKSSKPSAIFCKRFWVCLSTATRYKPTATICQNHNFRTLASIWSTHNCTKVGKELVICKLLTGTCNYTKLHASSYSHLANTQWQ